MDLTLKAAEEIGGTIRAPASKSYTHRAFVIAGLAEGRSNIRDYLAAADTMSTLSALEAFGVEVTRSGSEVVITGSGGRLRTPQDVVDCGNSGTSIRLLSSVAALDGKVTLTGDDSVRSRPMAPLLDALGELGVVSSSDEGTPPVTISGGGIKGGRTGIRGDISSQFISSILIAAPYATTDVTVDLTTPLRSRPYVDLTLDIMKRFGVQVENTEYRSFRVPSGRPYTGCHYTVEGDYSSSSYFLALAAMTGSTITVRNLFSTSKQGDRVMLGILECMGAGVTTTADSVTVTGGSLRGITVDLSDSPDLLPTVAALATVAHGTTEIVNVEHARLKESDRIAACANEFRKFGATIEERKDGLVITGTPYPEGATLKTYHDHRMVMALAITGLCARGETTLKDIDPVNISFPDFFHKLRELGVEL